jgi:hypothetical protein
VVIDRAAFNQGANAQFDIKITASQTMATLVSKGPHAVGVSQEGSGQPTAIPFPEKQEGSI